jgi:translation initiation factor 1
VADDKPFHNPFAALGPLRDRLPPAPEPAPAASSSAAPSPPAGAGRKTYPRAVVRIERTGRGGKEVTIVEHLELAAAEREKWLKALKAALGCGGVIEGTSLVLQGDHRKRLPAILSERGVRRVTTA